MSSPAVSQFDESDRRLVEIFENKLSDAESTLTGMSAAFPQQPDELRSYIAKCKQLLMDLKYVKTVSKT